MLYFVVEVGFTDILPLVARFWFQPPVPTHAVALVDDQVRVLLPPDPITGGDADKVAVGGTELTVTVVLADLVPPAPVQLMVYVVVDAGDTDLLPKVAVLVVHVALQEVALVEDQVNVLEPPELIGFGLAESVTVGAGDDDETGTE